MNSYTARKAESQPDEPDGSELAALLSNSFVRSDNPVQPTEQPAFLPITFNEKFIIAANAIAAGLGTTIGALGEFLWFITTDVASGGLGVVMTGAAATGIITGIGVISALAAVPLIYLTYHELHEAKTFEEKHHRIFAARNLHHKKIFFELLRIRALLNNDADLTVRVKKAIPELDTLADFKKLIAAVNAAYHKLENNEYAVNWRYKESLPPVFVKTKNQTGTHTFRKLLQDEHVTSDMLCDSVMQEVDVFANYKHYFKQAPRVQLKSKRTAVAYGMGAGFGVFGCSLGSGWAFGALVITAGLAAAIPVAGWIALAVGSIVLGVVFGLGMGVCKQNNMLRKAQNTADADRNEALYRVKKSAQLLHANTRQHKSDVEKNWGTISQLRRRFDIPKIVIQPDAQQAVSVAMDVFAETSLLTPTTDSLHIERRRHSYSR